MTGLMRNLKKPDTIIHNKVKEWERGRERRGEEFKIKKKMAF